MIEYSLNPLTAVPLVLCDSRALYILGFNTKVKEEEGESDLMTLICSSTLLMSESKASDSDYSTESRA